MNCFSIYETWSQPYMRLNLTRFPTVKDREAGG